METVRFVSAKPYLNLPNEEFDKIFFCLKGRKEVVILCSSELKNILKDLPSNYVQPQFKDIVKYLNDNEIPYVVGDLNKTTKI